MRYGLISDVHGNWEALQAVLRALEKEAVDQILCAGDIVGYGADPQECLVFFRTQSIPCVAGNHDWGVCGLLDLARFNPWAQTAILWTRQQLKQPELDFLKALPLSFQNDMMSVTHGTFDDPSRFKYLSDSTEARHAFPYLERKLGVVGHTHIPGFYVQQGENIRMSRGPVLHVGSEEKVIINVGSVGQPRDRDDRAAYGIYDSDEQYLEIKREPYDVESAQHRMRERGLPAFLSERIAGGM
ncbi:MAG TPA: metallophosphoesterase family protein [Candidatus Omnitrophota bacterium]|nr:metallophosphoesterase family protein [Candidatus Omnitrophota bacterium]HQO57959.1 metallophosphoesterase family protein [Candidatus Omnitrophota bacterium]HQP11959.1 metallophosphoesterase family protein [Candidatus Omnitrophota bacterium]